MNHPTTKIEVESETIEWKCSVRAGNSEQVGAFTVNAINRIQALNKAWKIVQRNPERYGITVFEPGELTIGVVPSD